MLSVLGPLTRDASRSMGIGADDEYCGARWRAAPFRSGRPVCRCGRAAHAARQPLRRLREGAGITPERAGYEIRASRSKISRLENGRVGLKTRDLTDLLTLYGVTDEALRSPFRALATGPARRTGGLSTATSCPTGSRRTSGSRPRRRPSAASRSSSCTGCSRPRSTRGPSPGAVARPRRRRDRPPGRPAAQAAGPAQQVQARPGSGRSWTRPCCGGRSAGRR